MLWGGGVGGAGGSGRYGEGEVGGVLRLCLCCSTTMIPVRKRAAIRESLIYLSFFLSLYPPIHPDPSIRLSTYRLTYLSIYPYVCISLALI